MKLVQLVYFCTASRYHSITKAAKELYVTQPAISSAIRSLEEEFSICLFIRNNNKLTLTDEGEKFYQRAEELLKHSRSIETEFKDLGKSRMSVSVGIPPMLSTVYFPKLMYVLQNEFPQLNIKLYEYGSIKACQFVQEDLLDFAIVNMELPESDKLNHAILDQDEFLFCVSRRHPLANRKIITLDMLEDIPLILGNTDSVQAKTLENQFQLAGKTPNIILYTSQVKTTINFLSDHKSGAFLYASMLCDYPDFIGIPMKPSIKQNVGLVWKKGKYLSSNFKKLITFTKDYFNS